MRAELRLLGNHHGIDVLDREAFFVEQLSRVLQKHQAVRALPLRIGVREVCADVAESRGAKQRVAERVSEHVSIGMTHWAFFERELDAANNQRAALGKSMQVIPNAAAEAHACVAFLRSCSR